MTDLTTRGGRAVIEQRASKAAAKIHAGDLAQKIAQRVKDPKALEKAIRDKLAHEAEFAAQYVALFPKGRPEKSARTGAFSDDKERVDWCLSFGFALRSVQRWCELCEPDKLAAKQFAVSKKCWQLAELWQAANFSSASVEWYTPAKYIAAVREVLGDIDLDPASSEQANTTVRAKEFFDDQGLDRDWFGRIFLNPPYGIDTVEIEGVAKKVSLAGAFCRRAIDQFQRRNIESCIILVNSLHSQTWQGPLYDFPICLVDHRIHFVSGDGDENENPTFQNIFVYLGADEIKFATVFARFGYVMRRIVP